MLQLERDIKKYSTAFLDLAASHGALEEVDEHMQNLKQFFVFVAASKECSHDYKQFVDKFALLSQKKKLDVIYQVMEQNNTNKLLKNFVFLLLASKKMRLFRSIVLKWDKIIFHYKGYVRILLTTVVPLSDSQEKKIKELLNDKFGEKYYIEKKLDKSILGGLLMEFNSEIIDDTLSSKLMKIKNHIQGIE